ncbi:MAG: RHS repeat-associated core domain-containing protein, partial [Pseudomonadota bacterium]
MARTVIGPSAGSPRHTPPKAPGSIAIGPQGHLPRLGQDHAPSAGLRHDGPGGLAGELRPWSRALEQITTDTFSLESQHLRFPGQWFQSETGLHQNWHRDYDPRTGRYLQADPLGLADGPSVYGYVSQRPFRFIDPRGQQAIGCDPRIPGEVCPPTEGGGGGMGGSGGRRLSLHTLWEICLIFLGLGATETPCDNGQCDIVLNEGS